MADTYVTLNEAAELESIGYDTMKKRIHRNPEKFLITKEQRETGGKEMTMVAISSLSKKARTAWKERGEAESGCGSSGSGSRSGGGILRGTLRKTLTGTLKITRTNGTRLWS